MLKNTKLETLNFNSALNTFERNFSILAFQI